MRNYTFNGDFPRGIKCNRLLHSETPDVWRKFNIQHFNSWRVGIQRQDAVDLRRHHLTMSDVGSFVYASSENKFFCSPIKCEFTIVISIVFSDLANEVHHDGRFLVEWNKLWESTLVTKNLLWVVSCEWEIGSAIVGGSGSTCVNQSALFKFLYTNWQEQIQVCGNKGIIHRIQINHDRSSTWAIDNRKGRGQTWISKSHETWDFLRLLRLSETRDFVRLVGTFWDLEEERDFVRLDGASSETERFVRLCETRTFSNI